MNQNFKRIGIAAAGAATVLTLAVATPSLAHSNTGNKPVNGSTSTSVREAAHAHVNVAATVTAVPVSVTDAKAAAHGAIFTVYKLAADATAIAITQPTAGGKSVHIKDGVLAAGTLSGNLSLDAGAANTTSKYAIYSSTGVGTFVSVSVDAAGVATATPAVSLTATYVAPTEPVMGEGKRPKGSKAEGLERKRNGNDMPKGKKGRGGKH